MLQLLRRFQPLLHHILSHYISSWASQIDLHNSECVSASGGLREGSIVSTPQLFSRYGHTARSEAIAPSGSDDVVDHEACGTARSNDNDANATDASSRSKSKSATGFWIMVPVTPPNPAAIVLMVMMLLAVML